MPPREEWGAILERGTDEDRVVRMIRGIARIESAGGNVMVGAADVSNLAQMRAVVREATKKFGAIHGVIHAAGISGSTPIGLKTAEELDQVMRPKLLGLGGARADFRQSQPRFYGAVLIGGGLVGPSRTSRLCRGERLSRRLTRSGCRDKARWPVISINWDTWREVGMAINTLRVKPGEARPQALNFGLLTTEGIRAFKQALVARHPQVIARKPPAGPAAAAGQLDASDWRSAPAKAAAASRGRGAAAPADPSAAGACASLSRARRANCRRPWQPCGSISCVPHRSGSTTISSSSAAIR